MPAGGAIRSANKFSMKDGRILSIQNTFTHIIANYKLHIVSILCLGRLGSGKLRHESGARPTNAHNNGQSRGQKSAWAGKKVAKIDAIKPA